MKVTPASALSADAATAFAAAERAAGRVVVLTHGVFDLLHPGHLQLLATARAHGDRLIVAVRADTPHDDPRPTQPDFERAEVLAALASVDAVYVEPDASLQTAIERIHPDVLVISADDSQVVPTSPATSTPRLVRVPADQTYSTAAIVAKIQNQG